MRQAKKHNWNYQNKNPQFIFPVEPSQETNPEQDQDPFMTPQMSPPKINAMAKAIIIQGIKAEPDGAVVEKVADLRTDRKCFSVISMAMSRIIQLISAPRKREH
jgi:hypothetical protein